MERTPDNYDQFLQHERTNDDKPVCSWCGEPIEDYYYYEIESGAVCENCIDSTKKYI